MPILESLSLSSAGKIISAIWANGSRFLFSVAVAAAVAAGVLRLSAYYSVSGAQRWWDDYGLMLMLGAAIVAVFGVFKAWAERSNVQLFLMADEAQSLWHHAKQGDGSIHTQFSLRFHATNRAKQYLFLSKVSIVSPWIKRRKVYQAIVSTQGVDGAYGQQTGIPPGARRACHAHLMVKGEVGGAGRKKPMYVKIAVQDNLLKWHSLAFVDLQDPQADS